MYPRQFFTMTAISCATLSVSSGLVWSAPAGGNIVSGTGSISQAGNLTTVQQSSPNLLVDWQSFNIQAGEQVDFNQPGASAIALNRDFSGVASELFGSLNANGQVYLFNTAGILVGPTANLNASGLFLSDMTVSDAEFESLTRNGSMTLTDSDTQAGGIRIEGAFTTTTRSGITVIGQFIENSGTLTANNGNINLAVAGGPIVVTDPGSAVGVQISNGIRNDISPDQVLLDNSGEIRANNGNVDINIQTLSALNLRAVRNTGLVNATGIGFGEINQNIVLQAPQAIVGPDSPIDEIVSDSLAEDASPVPEQPLSEAPAGELTALDRLVPDCQSDDPNDQDCVKKAAIKRYLGRLLIGGGLPE